VGIGRLSPNDLRRAHAQWLRRGGVQPADLAPVMGHADSRMVERVYGKVTAVDLAPRLSASLAGGLPALPSRGLGR
jgi:integrase